MSLMIKIAVFFGAAYVCYFCICAVNAMNTRTQHGMRIAVAVLASGCFFEAAQVFVPDYVPSLGEVLIIAGLAIGTAFNRREAICPCVQVVHRAPPKQGART